MYLACTIPHEILLSNSYCFYWIVTTTARSVIEAGHGIEEIGEVIMAVQKCKSERLKSVQAFGWNGPLDFLSGAVDTTMVATFRTMKRRGSKILKESIHSAIEGLGIKKLQPRRRSYSNPAC